MIRKERVWDKLGNDLLNIFFNDDVEIVIFVDFLWGSGSGRVDRR